MLGLFAGLTSTATLAESIECPIFEVPIAQANAGCLLVEQDGVLLVKQWSAKWALPGGTADAGETAQCTAFRETWEETGLRVNVGELIHVFDNGFHLFNCQRLVGEPKLNTGRPFTLEVRAVRWVDVESFDTLNWRFKNQQFVIKRWLLKSKWSDPSR